MDFGKLKNNAVIARQIFLFNQIYDDSSLCQNFVRTLKNITKICAKKNIA